MAAAAAWVVVGAAIVALVAIGLFLSHFGDAFGRLNDLALLVMTVALLPIMAAYYELGGRTPLRLAQLARASALLAVAAWSIAQIALILGTPVDYERPASGILAVEAVPDIVIGAWLAGASLFAGSWLQSWPRWAGFVAGLGTMLFAAGLLLGGVSHPLTTIGGIGHQVVLPIWAGLLARSWRSEAASAAGEAG